MLICVFVCVCLYTFSATASNGAPKERYQRLQSDMGKMLRSNMAAASCPTAIFRRHSMLNAVWNTRHCKAELNTKLCLETSVYPPLAIASACASSSTNSAERRGFVIIFYLQKGAIYDYDLRVWSIFVGSNAFRHKTKMIINVIATIAVTTITDVLSRFVILASRPSLPRLKSDSFLTFSS